MLSNLCIKPIQDGPFRGCSGMEGKKAPLPKIGYTNATRIKVGTVIPYIKNIQKIYEPRDIPLEVC